ncbi:MAG: RNA polymerase sigma factor [Vicinamibacteria bacterium]
MYEEQNRAHAALIARIQAGDSGAEDEFVSTFQRRVFVVMLGRIADHDGAREATQDVLVAVLSAIRDGRIREPEKLAGFMHGVARNLANNRIRRQADEPIWVELDETAAWADAAEEAEMADRRRELAAAIARLDETDRRILSLAVVEGRSAPEVAAALALSPDAVRARKSRALRKVGDWLQARLSQLAQGAPLSYRGE